MNSFVDKIYADHYQARKVNIAKKHLKVVLLDLYVNWSNDPSLVTAFHRNKNAYKAASVYNELHISPLIIDVVDTLIDAGFVEQEKGFYNQGDGSGRVARIWPTEKLIHLFQKARFSPFDVWFHGDRKLVVLRNRDDEDVENDDVEYEPTSETDAMEKRLAAYNDLLRHTFIDIPDLEEPFIRFESGKSKLPVNQHSKLVRRIFNRGSFEYGGRFWGGWWQRASKECRGNIFINDQPTTEIDFSGFHIVMLYGIEGINYWEELKEDTYIIDKPDFIDTEEDCRSVVKGLMLVLLNNPPDKSAFSAFRSKAESGSFEKRLTNIQLGEIQRDIEAKHPKIKKYFGADAGVWLMNKDAQIAGMVIDEFTETGIPILCVHDSFVVPVGHEDYLRETMAKAFEKVVGVPMMPGSYEALEEGNERIEDIWTRLNMTWMPYSNVPGRDEAEEDYRARVRPNKAERYRRQLQLFQDWLKSMGLRIQKRGIRLERI